MFSIWSSVFTDDISNSGRSTNLSLTSNREPFTQHLHPKNKHKLCISKLQELKFQLGKAEPLNPPPHYIWIILCTYFTERCIGLKMLCILQKNTRKILKIVWLDKIGRTQKYKWKILHQLQTSSLQVCTRASLEVLRKIQQVTMWSMIKSLTKAVTLLNLDLVVVWERKWTRDLN